MAWLAPCPYFFVSVFARCTKVAHVMLPTQCGELCVRGIAVRVCTTLVGPFARKQRHSCSDVVHLNPYAWIMQNVTPSHYEQAGAAFGVITYVTVTECTSVWETAYLAVDR